MSLPTLGPAAPSTVLVTGGAGYIGSVLVGELLGRGYRVRVLDSLLYGGGAIAGLTDHPRLELVVDDMRRAVVVEAAMRGADAIIHLAAIVGDAACAVDEGFTTQVNLEATRLLIAAARRAGVRRFLFASTCSVYGASDGELDEGSALHPVSLYADTKIAAEEALLAARDAGFAPTILRLATVYGPSRRPRFDLVVNLLTAKAVTEGRITIHGGEQWRPFVHVADIARALVVALEAPIDAVDGEIFNVGSTAENYRLTEVGEIIAEVVPSARVEVDDRIHDRRDYLVSFDKLRDRLGFSPSHSVRSGVEEIRDLVAHGDVSDYRDPAYDNHRFLSGLAPERRALVDVGD